MSKIVGENNNKLKIAGAADGYSADGYSTELKLNGNFLTEDQVNRFCEHFHNMVLHGVYDKYSTDAGKAALRSKLLDAAKAVLNHNFICDDTTVSLDLDLAIIIEIVGRERLMEIINGEVEGKR